MILFILLIWDVNNMAEPMREDINLIIIGSTYIT